MLSSLHLGDGQNIGTTNGKIALDCSIRPTRQGHVVISTTDFFFPLVDSPYLQGYIGAANVLSDLYAEGVSSCDFVLMLLAACRDMADGDRAICTREMVHGFNDACLHAGTVVTGGQTVINPWPVIGGVATTICSEGEYVRSNGAKVGDVVVLTKPLGTQIAVNVHEWRRGNTTKWNEICTRNILSEEQAKDMMHTACCSMATLNRNAGSIMVKHNAHAGTDVTGFGILGHAQNLMDNQIEEVGMEIHTLPCIKNTLLIETSGIFNFRLAEGYSAETSGGLMICMSESDAISYCKELKLLNSNDGGGGGDDEDPCCWIIGRIVASTERKACVVENVTIIEV
jgi:selenide,water dikinase